jgi:hypothetical protein
MENGLPALKSVILGGRINLGMDFVLIFIFEIYLKLYFCILPSQFAYLS